MKHRKKRNRKPKKPELKYRKQTEPENEKAWVEIQKTNGTGKRKRNEARTKINTETKSDKKYRYREELDMCVGLSAKVVRVSEGTALVDAFGARREVSADLIGDLEPGDFVMIHAGAAIAKITEDDETQADDLMRELIG